MDNLTYYVAEVIQRDDAEQAKLLIKEIEKRMEEEPSSFNLQIMRNLLIKLRRFYASKIEIGLENTTVRKDNFVKVSLNSFDGNEKKKVFTRFNSTTVERIACTDLEVSECNDFAINSIECEETILFRDIKNSRFTTKSKYIRVLSCNNIFIEVTSNTEIFLQDSSNIVIRPCSETDILPEVYVYDFSCPVDSKNYKIVYYCLAIKD